MISADHSCINIFASYMAHYLHCDKFLSQIDTKMKLETALAKFKVDIDFEIMHRSLAPASNTLLLDIFKNHGQTSKYSTAAIQRTSMLNFLVNNSQILNKLACGARELMPPIDTSKNFRYTWLQSYLQTFPSTHKKSYPKFLNPISYFDPLVQPKVE